jgi:protein dpy-30
LLDNGSSIAREREDPMQDANLGDVPMSANPVPDNQGTVSEAPSAPESTATPKAPNQGAVAQLPIRAYLDQTVIPHLLTALSALVKERPPNPVEWLATYLLQNNDKQQQPQSSQPAGEQ